MTTGSISHASEIAALIRASQEYESAAIRFLDIYETRMRSAGAALFAAFSLALRDSGGSTSDQAALRYYKSTKSRSWWWAHLNAQGVSREWAKRVIQWHVDPAKAVVRRKRHVESVKRSRAALVAVRQHVRNTPGFSLSDLKLEARRLSAAVGRVALSNVPVALGLVRETVAEIERLTA